MRKLLSTAVLGLILTGCTTPPSPDDPYEAANREIFTFNMAVDRLALRPTAERYNAYLPESARTGIHNLLTHLHAPVVFANDVLQGEAGRAGETLSRFTVNTALGLGGLIDVATRLNIESHEEDFGQTLAVWGAGDGPYLMLPFFGPSNPRDAAGMAGDAALDPTSYIRIKRHILWSGVRLYATVLDARAANIDALDGIERDSLDFYATVKSLYRQHQHSEIRNGIPDPESEAPPADLPVAEPQNDGAPLTEPQSAEHLPQKAP
jgi:Surface lipoprotein